MRSGSSLVLAVVLAAPLAYGDVTVRYHNDTKLLPAPMADQTIRIKGNRASFNINNLASVVDFTKQELTILDPQHKLFATIPLSRYSARVKAAMPEMSGMMEQMFDPAKTKVASASTGRTETIQGIAAEETEVTVTVAIPVPQRDSSDGAEIKVTMRVWTAKPDQFLRTPGLSELAAFSVWQSYFMESSDLFPGQKAMMEKMMPAGGVILRTHMEMRMRMPGVAAAEAAVAAPIMEMNQDISEISTAPVEESFFRIPAEYTGAPFEELFRGAIQATIPSPQGDADVKAYVPNLMPLTETQPGYSGTVHGMVELLVTIDAQGRVTHTEVLAGPGALRPAAVDAVKQRTYRPVIRAGAPVAAYTDATVTFLSQGDSAMTMPDVPETMAASERRMALQKELPRSPQQILADLEQDSGGGSVKRRYYALDGMAKAAVQAGALDKAAVYARELLSLGSQNEGDWNYGNAIHDGNMVLGLVALRQGDISKAGDLLLAAGRTPGSPQLNSFGPDMTLAKELLQKGESGIVLKYFSLCVNFWAMGAHALEEWSRTVRDGGMPAFGANLR